MSASEGVVLVVCAHPPPPTPSNFLFLRGEVKMCGIISKGFVSMTVAQNFFPAPSHSSVKKIFLQKFIMFRGGSGGGVKELQPPFDIFCCCYFA